jgi:hypothetical protein
MSAGGLHFQVFGASFPVWVFVCSGGAQVVVAAPRAITNVDGAVEKLVGVV